MRRLDLTFTALLVPIDFLALLCAGLTAYALRFSGLFSDLKPLIQYIPFGEYVLLSSLFALAWMGIFAIAGLYQTRLRRAWNEFGRIIICCTAGIMLIIATVFFSRELATSRFVILAVWGVSIIYVEFARIVLRLIRYTLLRSGQGHLRFALIGNAPVTHDLQAMLKDHPFIGVTIARHVTTWSTRAEHDLAQLYSHGGLDGIILCDPSVSKEDALAVISFAEFHHLVFRYLADPFAARFSHVEMSVLGGIPLLEVKPTRLDGWGRIAKRASDILIAGTILVCVSPLLFILGVIRVLEDGWPWVFLNERVGEGGKLFYALKIRSMWKQFCIGPQFTQNASDRLAMEQKLIKERGLKAGPVYKVGNDPRVTPFGAFIRRWSLDELPQLWNVIRGDMSLVGPRPHQPREVAQYAPDQRRVLAIKPGITGMAQISGRSNLSFEDEVRLDTYYIEHWSPALDLYILLKTPFVVLRKTGAY